MAARVDVVRFRHAKITSRYHAVRPPPVELGPLARSKAQGSRCEANRSAASCATASEYALLAWCPQVEEQHAAEAEVRELAAALRTLERRVAQLEAGEAPTSSDASPTEDALVAPDGAEESQAGGAPEWTRALSVALTNAPALLGRLLLVLGGAYLLRSLTEDERVPATVGAALGVGYGMIWLAAAHRAGLKGRRPSAS